MRDKGHPDPLYRYEETTRGPSIIRVMFGICLVAMIAFFVLLHWIL